MASKQKPKGKGKVRAQSHDLPLGCHMTIVMSHDHHMVLRVQGATKLKLCRTCPLDHVTTALSHDSHMIFLPPPLLLFQRAQQQQEEDDDGPAELLAKLREYVFKFSSPTLLPSTPPSWALTVGRD